MQGRRRALLRRLAHPGRILLLTAAVVLVLDQVSKAVVRSSFTVGESRPLIDGLFHLTFQTNTGAAFGLLPGRQPVFIATSLLVLFAVAVYWRRMKPAAWPVVIALGLVVGGAIGNLIDRAFIGHVTDFFDVVAINFPVFNIADSAIVVGVGILMLWLLLVPDEDATSEAAASDTAAADDEAPE